MKRITLLFALLFALNVIGQEITHFNKSKSKLDQKLMLTLGTWSAVNTGVGIYGWATSKDESMYFHQMNVMWSGVNLALAIPGYLKARKSYSNTLTFAEMYKAQSRTEKVFLFNTALDIAYITGGFLFKASASNNTETYHQFRGYGNSLILQGSFLFLFDLSAALIHSSRRLKTLDPELDKVALRLTGNTLGLTYIF
ncbi:MAG: DUF6992 family protein [Lishizhenia sp.]